MPRAAPPESVTILVNGEPLEARAGETVASALLRAGRRVLRRSAGAGTPRGIFCGIGLCYECLVTLDGQPKRRACLAPVREGLRVEIPRAR